LDSDDQPRRDERREGHGRQDEYGGGREEYGRREDDRRQEGYSGGREGYGGRDDDRRQEGYGGGGSHNSGGYGRNDDYDNRFNQGRQEERMGGNHGPRRDEDRYGGGSSGGYGGGQSTGRYGEQDKYSGPQSGVESTPYNAPQSGYDGPHRPQQSGGHGGSRRHDFDEDAVVGKADNDEDKSFFSSALSFLNNKKDDDDDIDEGRMQQKHDEVYQGRPNERQDSDSLGAAAAMHAFQMFSGGSGKQSGGSQNDFIGMAFREASNLFEKQNSQGNVQSGVDKQSVSYKVHLQTNRAND
jgi:hypothetical protein